MDIRRVPNWVWGILILILIGASAFYFYKKPSVPLSPEDNASVYNVRNFSGYLSTVDESKKTITLKGIFLADQDNLPSDLREEQEFTFKVDERTEFSKTEITFPTPNDPLVTQNGGAFKIKDLPHKQSQGSFEDLKSLVGNYLADVSMQVSFYDSVVGLKTPLAAKISYRVMLTPDLGKPQGEGN